MGDSDLDLLLIVSDPDSRDEPIGMIHDIELELDVPLSPTIMTLAEYDKNKAMGSSFVKNVEREGIVIYDIEA